MCILIFLYKQKKTFVLILISNFVQVYPGQRAGGVEADMMAANELSTHLYLQVR